MRRWTLGEESRAAFIAAVAAHAAASDRWCRDVEAWLAVLPRESAGPPPSRRALDAARDDLVAAARVHADSLEREDALEDELSREVRP